MPRKRTLTDQQQKAVALLADGKTPAEAAAEVGADENVIKLVWLRDWLFTEAIRQRKKEREEAQREADEAQWRATSRRLRGLAGKAVLTLTDLLDSENETVRHRAATAILKAAGMAERDLRFE